MNWATAFRYMRQIIIILTHKSVTTRCWGHSSSHWTHTHKKKTSSLYFQPCQTAVNTSFISGYHSHITVSVAGSSLSDNPSPTPFHQAMKPERALQAAHNLSVSNTDKKTGTWSDVSPNYSEQYQTQFSSLLPLTLCDDAYRRCVQNFRFISLHQHRRITNAKSLEYHLQF